MEDDECIICYAALKESLLRPCVSCKTVMCEGCWYDACRMYCPLCSRRELNIPKKCYYCGNNFHIKDVWACCICRHWVCNVCEAEIPTHPCRIIREDIVLSNGKDIVAMASMRKLQGLLRCPLGKINYKNFNDDDVTMFVSLRDNFAHIWAFCKTLASKRKAREQKMNKLYFSSGSFLAYKSYDLSRKKCNRYIDALLAKYRSCS